jgi:hypothetical protein
MGLRGGLLVGQLLGKFTGVGFPRLAAGAADKAEESAMALRQHWRRARNEKAGRMVCACPLPRP